MINFALLFETSGVWKLYFFSFFLPFFFYTFFTTVLFVTGNFKCGAKISKVSRLEVF